MEPNVFILVGVFLLALGMLWFILLCRQDHKKVDDGLPDVRDNVPPVTPSDVLKQLDDDAEFDADIANEQHENEPDRLKPSPMHHSGIYDDSSPSSDSDSRGSD